MSSGSFIFNSGGGADEIGASFYVLRFGDVFVGIDFGFRPQKAEGGVQILPDWRVAPKLDYLFLTHAHLDHAGAIPLALKRWSKVKIFMTQPTKELASSLWHETIRLAFRNQTSPVFSPDDIANTNYLINDLPLNSVIELAPELTVEAPEAGHILGAVSLMFTWHGEIVFVTGDIAFHDQETVLGAKILRKSRIKLLVSEATYASELEPARRQEERLRFESDILKAVDAKRRILIPAPSIDRTPKVYALIKDILERAGTEVPIYIDGAGREMIRIYKRFTDRIDPNIEDHFVRDRYDRKRIVKERPVIIIASHGMMVGGRSVTYGQQFLHDAEAMVALTTFQDPCSPGFKLQASEIGDLIVFNGVLTLRRCDVIKYNFSAHASGLELIEMQERLNPDVTILTHGIPEKMQKMIDFVGTKRKIIIAHQGMEVAL